MIFDASPRSFAAIAIQVLFWWTVLSPLGLLAVAVLCASRLRLRAALTLIVLAPPVLVFLPVVVTHGRFAGPAAGAALLDGVGGGMLGSAALVGALILA